MPEQLPGILRLSLCVVTIDPAAGSSYLATVCGLGGTPEVDLGGVPVRITLRAFEAEAESELVDLFGTADGAALLIHHVDAISMERLKGAYRILPSDHRLPICLMLVRESGRLEFKMACPTCNQKLWVRDEDQGRIGRCPHCKNTFVLPAQGVHIKTQLALPASVPLMTVTLGNPAACRGPLVNLAERARLRARVLNSTTVQVQMPSDMDSASL